VSDYNGQRGGAGNMPLPSRNQSPTSDQQDRVRPVRQPAGDDLSGSARRSASEATDTTGRGEPQPSASPGQATTRYRNAAYIDSHAVQRWLEHVDRWTPYGQALRFIDEFIKDGVRLSEPPDWTTAMPCHEYYTHQDWPGVVVVFEPNKRHVVTVRVKQESVTRHGLTRRLNAR
jgi:hypothetical protein